MSSTGELLLSFRDDISFTHISAQETVLEWKANKLHLKQLSAGMQAAFAVLASDGASEHQLHELVCKTDDAVESAFLRYYLQRFEQLCLLRYTLLNNLHPLAIVIPMTAGFTAERASTGKRFRLSRFAFCRRDGELLVVESSLSMVRILLPSQLGVALIAELAQPCCVSDLCTAVNEISEDIILVFLNLLANADVVGEVAENGFLAEDSNSALMQWEFHDLLFHTRSRMGRHDYPSGGAFPFLGEIPPLPALKPQMTSEVISLPQPDLGQLLREDPPFLCTLEGRKSIRTYSKTPINSQQLGEFLYRTARVRQLYDPDPARFRLYQTSNRPYPSGGASYELELYLAIHRCTGITTGMYHYDPLKHCLCRLDVQHFELKSMLDDAQASAALAEWPQVLIILASRFQRLAWKYRSIAYATTLRNVGVLYQTMYLVATAMGLAPCGLGNGDSALFSRAAGLSPWVESSVGEFMLGSITEN